MIVCSFWGSPSSTFGSACTCTAARSFRTHFFYVQNTLVTVSASGMNNPTNAWACRVSPNIGDLNGSSFSRSGVQSSLAAVLPVMISSSWPRAALGNVARLVDLQNKGLATGTDLFNEARPVAIALRDQVMKLRAVLQNGANESLYFSAQSAWLQSRYSLRDPPSTGSVGLVPASKGSTGVSRPGWSGAVSRFTKRSDMNCEYCPNAAGSRKVIKEGRLETAFQTLEERLLELFATGITRNYSLEDALDLANRNALTFGNTRRASKIRWPLWPICLYRETRRPAIKPRGFRLPSIDMSRLRDGVKPAIAATGALLICNWFNPPGAAAIPLGALALTFL